MKEELQPNQELIGQIEPISPIDILIGEEATSLDELTRQEERIRALFPIYLEQRVEPAVREKKQSKTLVEKTNAEETKQRWYSIWDVEFVDSSAEQAKKLIEVSLLANDKASQEDIAQITKTTLQKLRMKKNDMKRVAAIANEATTNVLASTVGIPETSLDNAIASLSVNVTSFDSEQVRKKIESEIKRYIFTTAARLGKMQLTRMLLTEDIAAGRIPKEIETLIGEFSSQNLNTTFDTLQALSQDFLRYVAAKITPIDTPENNTHNPMESIRYVPRPIVRPTLYTEDLFAGEVTITQLGPTILRTDIPSGDGPYPYLPEYRTFYPQTVVQALFNLYEEYNKAFKPLVTANQEWDSDYQYCIQPDGTPLNRWVQFDMVGLTDDLLKRASSLDLEETTELLRGRIFEIENNLACYPEMMFIFRKDNQPWLFEKEFRRSLDVMRKIYGMPIALLATTEAKYQAMRRSEFGKFGEKENDTITPDEVVSFSGFDMFFGPREFERYLAENNGDCPCLLYVRSSEPTDKLRNPKVVVENPLLVNPQMRKIIKAQSLTFNVDDPRLPYSNKTITDSKMYLPSMGMAFPIITLANLDSPEFLVFLQMQGIDPQQIAAGQTYLRAKPGLKSYGGYAQERGYLKNADFRQKIKTNLRQRGPYVLQPEMKIPLVMDQDGNSFGVMDRVYVSTDGKKYRFMGGERYFMPTNAQEYERGRIHGNRRSVLGEITN